jgi:hypothetical protein|tara:strand:+ start:775 stop:1179 length:405 start_codon:yes stop_codon:yes gene_type:complete
MPYKLFKVKGGWKVGKKDGTKMSNGRKYASNKPLTKEKALGQMRAIIISEKRNHRGVAASAIDSSMIQSLMPQESPTRLKLIEILKDKCGFGEGTINYYMSRIRSEERVREIIIKMKQNIRNPCEEVKDENENL